MATLDVNPGDFFSASPPLIAVLHNVRMWTVCSSSTIVYRSTSKYNSMTLAITIFRNYTQIKQQNQINDKTLKEKWKKVRKNKPAIKKANRE